MNKFLQIILPKTYLVKNGNLVLNFSKKSSGSSNTDQVGKIKPNQRDEINAPFLMAFINSFQELFLQNQLINKPNPKENRKSDTTPNVVKNLFIIILPSSPRNDDLSKIANSDNMKCDENFQCKSGYFCFASKCQALCHDLYNPCPPGFLCQNGLCNKINIDNIMNVIPPNIVSVQPPKSLLPNPPVVTSEQPSINFQSTNSISQVPMIEFSSKAIVEMSTEPITLTSKEPISITQQVTNNVTSIVPEVSPKDSTNSMTTNSMTTNTTPPSTTESMSNLLFNITNRLLSILPDKKVSNRMLQSIPSVNTLNPVSNTKGPSVCTENKDCQDHYFCFNEACHPECHKLYNPCPRGYICIRGWCRKIFKGKLGSKSNSTSFPGINNFSSVNNTKSKSSTPDQELNLTTNVCDKDSDCKLHHFCFNKKCHPRCHEIYNPCIDGYNCAKGWCTRINELETRKDKKEPVKEKPNIEQSNTFINDHNILGSMENLNINDKDNNKDDIMTNEDNSFEDNVVTTTIVPNQDFFMPHLGIL